MVFVWERGGSFLSLAHLRSLEVWSILWDTTVWRGWTSVTLSRQVVCFPGTLLIGNVLMYDIAITV